MNLRAIKSSEIRKFSRLSHRKKTGTFVEITEKDVNFTCVLSKMNFNRLILPVSNFQ